jgi:hypothetical protein
VQVAAVELDVLFRLANTLRAGRVRLGAAGGNLVFALVAGRVVLRVAIIERFVLAVAAVAIVTVVAVAVAAVPAVAAAAAVTVARIVRFTLRILAAAAVALSIALIGEIRLALGGVVLTGGSALATRRLRRTIARAVLSGALRAALPGAALAT